MKKLFILSSLFISITLYAQEDNSLYLYQQMQTVEKLCQYDNIAWRTSDSIVVAPFYERSELGPEWFCIENNGTWNAYYGKLIDSTYHIVFNYKVNGTDKIERIRDTEPSEQLNQYALALNTAYKDYWQQISEYNISFNKYIFRNSDNSFLVYLLPAFQTNNIAAYGAEFIYHINATGDSILSKNIYFPQHIRGFYVNNEEDIRLDYNDTEHPTLGALFFGWYYKNYFKSITIETQKMN